jgi:hypothetical protein
MRRVDWAFCLMERRCGLRFVAGAVEHRGRLGTAAPTRIIRPLLRHLCVRRLRRRGGRLAPSTRRCVQQQHRGNIHRVHGRTAQLLLSRRGTGGGLPSRAAIETSPRRECCWWHARERPRLAHEMPAFCALRLSTGGGARRTMNPTPSERTSPLEPAASESRKR